MTPYGTPTQTYIDLIESFEGKSEKTHGKEKKAIETLFSEMSRLKKAYMDGQDEIVGYDDAINTLLESIVQLNEKGVKKSFEDFEKTLIPINRELESAQFNVDRFNALLKHAPEEQRSKLLDLMNVYIEEQINALKDLIVEYEKQLPLLVDQPELYDKIKTAIDKTKLSVLQYTNAHKDNIETQKKDLETIAKEREKQLEEDKQKADKLIDSYHIYR